MDRPKVGSRVEFTQAVERFPSFIAPVGTVGTVVEVTDSLVSVKADTPIDGAEGWNNCVHFYAPDWGEFDYATRTIK